MNIGDCKATLNADISWLGDAFKPVERIQCALWVYDIDNFRVLWCNNSALAVWQAESKQELLSRDMGTNMSAAVAQRLKQYKLDFSNNESIQFKEIWTLYPNGVPTSMDMVFSSFRLKSGRLCMLCEATDQSANDSEALRSAEALLHTSVSISLYAATGESLYRNPAARSSVRTANSTLTQHFSNPKLLSQLQDNENDEVNAITSVNTVNGVKWHDITARRCTDAVSGEAAWLISEVDVSRLKATEERAQFLAEHDTLTQLPNRNYVSIYFQSRIDKLLSEGRTGGLVFIDLDNFKDVNDSLGHDAGDQLLVEVGNRLKYLSTRENSLARLGGDEFLLLLSNLENEKCIEQIVQNIIQEVARPILLQGRELQITPSIGIALFPNNGTNIQELMRHADLAMYHAKESGRNNFTFFTKELSDAVNTRLSLESEIKTALKNNEFVAYFQPRVDVNSGAVVGAEALARWLHPTRGTVAPNIFIPVCEESGLISNLGKHIFTQCVVAQRRWAEHGHDLRLSVNLSPLQFAENTMVEDLIRIIEENRGNAKRIELEITESVLLGNDHETIDKLHKLVEYGFKISIDDFGTGYSNLAYLHRYPISCLKIDRSFVQSLETVKPIIELIISMAKLFDLYVVAEGVETPEQLEMLREFKCQEYQGFLFEKPIEFDRFTDLINGHESKVA